MSLSKPYKFGDIEISFWRFNKQIELEIKYPSGYVRKEIVPNLDGLFFLLEEVISKEIPNKNSNNGPNILQ